MGGNQKAEVPAAPPRWLIPWITRCHVALYEWSGGRVGARVQQMPHVVVRGVGRRSGKPFAVCLPYWLDEEGDRIVVASFAGATRNPAWYHNMRDRDANPTVELRDGDHVSPVRVEEIVGEERDRIWKQIVEDRPFYGRYQDKTARRIPLLRLLEI